MPPRPSRTSGHPSGGGSARARRRRSHGAGGHAEEGGAERWLVTYADMLTLLLVLFIVLFSISVVNKSKFEELKVSLAQAFGDGGDGILTGSKGLNDHGSDAGDQVVVADDVDANDNSILQNQQQIVTKENLAAQVTSEIQNYERIEKAIDSALEKKGMTGAVSYKVDHRGLIITVVTLTVGLSVYAHGVTAAPLAGAYARWFASHREPPRMESADVHEHRLRRPALRAHVPAPERPSD